MKTSLVLALLLGLAACSGAPKTSTVTEGTGNGTGGSGYGGTTEPPDEGHESMRGQACPDDASCPDDMQCITYYGIAGPSGPSFNSCETPCPNGKGCPEGTTCTTVSDGPGQVCR